MQNNRKRVFGLLILSLLITALCVSFAFADPMACPTCGATGKVNGKTCSACNGCGYVDSQTGAASITATGEEYVAPSQTPAPDTGQQDPSGQTNSNGNGVVSNAPGSADAPVHEGLPGGLMLPQQEQKGDLLANTEEGRAMAELEGLDEEPADDSEEGDKENGEFNLNLNDENFWIFIGKAIVIFFLVIIAIVALVIFFATRRKRKRKAQERLNANAMPKQAAAPEEPKAEEPKADEQKTEDLNNRAE